MAETETPPIRCPSCGSRQVRLSARQSRRRPVAIYRCHSCKRHFELADPNAKKRYRPFKVFKSFTIGGVVIGVLAAVSVGTALTVSLGSWEHETMVSPQIPSSPIDPTAPASVAGNDPASQYQHGLYFWSKGDYRQAFPWLKAAADKGNREARYYLGLAYLYGRATVQNYRLAFEQINKSAHQNFVAAQHQLGVMYRDGLGIPVNREQAYIWLNIAASRAHETASLDRDKLAIIMSEDEIAHAQDGTMKELESLDGGITPTAQATADGRTVPVP